MDILIAAGDNTVDLTTELMAQPLLGKWKVSDSANLEKDGTGRTTATAGASSSAVARGGIVPLRSRAAEAPA